MWGVDWQISDTSGTGSWIFAFQKLFRNMEIIFDNPDTLAYSRRFDVFSIPKWFSPVFLVFEHVKKLLFLPEEKNVAPEGLMSVPLKVGFYRGVGVRLLCRSQILLRTPTSDRSTEGRRWVKRCVFRCGHNGLGAWKNAFRSICQTLAGIKSTIIWIHLNSGLWFWHGTTHKSCC